MSLTRKTATYAGFATVFAIVAILAANIYVGAGASLTSSTNQGSSANASNQSSSVPSQAVSATSQNPSNAMVLVQLTDPPTVPPGTTSLNLTYSGIALLVSEPGSNNTVTTTTVAVTPTGGSATVDLLKLQNVSQTIASASLPSGSTIYSATFTVTVISIAINGTSSPVTLATGGSSYSVTLAKANVLSGTNALLLDLTPTVVETPAGYQLIPSSVGIMRPQSEIGPQSENSGWRGPLTDQDWTNLHNVQGALTANLLTLAVSGNKTTVTVQVGNSGNSSVKLVQIGLQGNLTVQASSCTSTTSSTTSTTTSGSKSTTSSETTTASGGKNYNGRANGQDFGSPGCFNPGLWGQNQLLFTANGASTTTSTTSKSTSTSTSSTTSPSTSTTSTGCTTGQMSLSNGIGLPTENGSSLVLSPGQCIIFTFTGAITFNHTQLTLVPSTAPGQVYSLSVVATNDAQANLSCTLPLSPTSCTTVNSNHGK